MTNIKYISFSALLNIALLATLLGAVSYGYAEDTVAERNPEWAQPVNTKLNLYQITPTLYRSEQIGKADTEQIKALGIKTVVSLRAFHKDDALFKDSEIITKRIPIYTWHVQDKEVVAALREIKAAEKIGPVLLHCQHGADRTGLVSAMYRMVNQGWDKDKAVKELKDGGYGYHAMWKNILKYLNRVNVAEIRKKVEQN